MNASENYEFLETLCICKGDSVSPENNLTHAQAYERAREIYQLQQQGKYNMEIITGKIIEPQKIVLYGESGVGKTTLGSQFPKPLIIDAERSSTHLDTPRVFVDNWRNLLDTLAECRECEFETIVLDTVDWAELKCAEYVCALYKKGGIEEFGYGKGYQYLAEEFMKLLKACDEIIRAGKNVVFLAHSQLRKVEPPDEGIAFDRYEPKLSKKVTPLIVEWCDALLFMFRKTYVEQSESGKGKAKGGKKREICANSASFCLAKSRWTNMPDEFDAEVKAICAHLPNKTRARAAVEKEEDARGQNETPRGETAHATDETPASPQKKLSDLLALGEFSEGEMLAYLYGKNKHAKAFIPAGTEFKDIPASLIEKMTTPKNWKKIEASLKANRDN